ncbi:MAG: rhodanese-like domain-containing protein [Acidimicrobiia bacterium]|nr:rhodanese-like domain-containing protein [Acidimicrobiia bacterium]
MLPNPAPTIEQVLAPEWEQWVTANNAVVLDVREPLEWAMGTLPGSVEISLGFLPASLDQLNQDRPILVVCRAGNRSQVAAQFLQRNGFNVANMFGGLTSIGLA